MNIELATNERRDLKPRGAKNGRGTSALMRWLGKRYYYVNLGVAYL